MIVVITHIYGRERNTTRNIENRKLEIGLSVRQNETQIHTHAHRKQPGIKSIYNAKKRWKILRECDVNIRITYCADLNG